MKIKDRARQLWDQNLHLASTDPRQFRKIIMDTLIQEYQCSIASASTQYNNIKNESPPVPGLGRKKVNSAIKASSTVVEPEVDDDDCYSVIELVGESLKSVGRTRSFILQGDASECFDSAVESYPESSWVLIQGLGPVHNEAYRLRGREREIKTYSPTQVVHPNTYVFEGDDFTTTISAASRSAASIIFQRQYPNTTAIITKVIQNTVAD